MKSHKLIRGLSCAFIAVVVAIRVSGGSSAHETRVVLHDPRQCSGTCDLPFQQSCRPRVSSDPFQFKQFSEGDRGRLVFRNLLAWRLGGTNDEGWYLGECRFSKVAPVWGALYGPGDLKLESLPNDWIVIGPEPHAAAQHFDGKRAAKNGQQQIAFSVARVFAPPCSQDGDQEENRD
jgi:hypothetical protein